MAEFYDWAQILHLLRQGGRVRKAGRYALWLWARQGAGVRARIGGQDLGPTHTRPGSREYSWERAGSADLEAGEPFAFELEWLEGGLPEQRGPAVGFAALAAEKDFDPRRAFETTRVFLQEPGPVPDQRLAETRGVHAPWTLHPYADLACWEKRKAQIRRHILACAGLWPLPERTPLRARIHGRVERPDYAVDKVYFESLPGFFVCGNLYRPAGKGPFPGIACPHGHWRKGRLENSPLGSVPGRCIELARRGFVVFSWDMAGYLDSLQVEHRAFGGRRQDLWGLGLLSLQLWNSIRALDFLLSLPEVDGERLGCTGASGGGTQAFLLTAVDERVRAVAPVNMVSAHMQGGCTCENQGHLRLDINNVEIAACAAPRPQLLVSATGDWTVHTPDLEYPYMRRIYALYGAEGQLRQKQVDAPHNYNRASREAVYAFFERVFHGDGRAARERPFEVERDEDLRVQIPGGLDAQGLVEAWAERSEARLESYRPGDRRSLGRLQRELGPGLGEVLGAGTVSEQALYVRDMGRTRRDSLYIERLLLGRREGGERIPALYFSPRPARSRMPAVLVVHPRGKAALADGDRGRPGPLLRALLARGAGVLAMDPFLVGEFHSPFAKEQRDAGVAHFHTYNRSVAACRVQDVLVGLAFLRSRTSAKSVHLLGLEGAGVWCLLARALDGGAGNCALDWGRADAGADAFWEGEEVFVPGLRSAGDVRTALGLLAPAPLLVHHTGGGFPETWASEVYRAAGAEERLVLSRRRRRAAPVLEWLLGGRAP